MVKHKILYISGSIGLGHVSNDYAIACKIRKLNPNAEITWIATNPADEYLNEKGELLHSESARFSSYSTFAEKAARNSKLNLVKYVLYSLIGWTRNVIIFMKIIRKENYDIVVGNETYEILIALILKLIHVKIPFVIIYDFLGMESMTKNPLERGVNYILNMLWSKDYKIFSKNDRKAIFIGEPEDIPNKKFGFLLPNRREYAKAHYNFIGYIISFNRDILLEKVKIKEELGYGANPLIVCSIGGTSIGKELLNLCIETFPILKKKLPDLHLVIVAGPRLSPGELIKQPGIELKGFVPNLFKYFVACDFAIVQGGGTTTLELTALNRPFTYFPIEGHSEQKLVSERLSRYSAGIRMDLSKTTSKHLSQIVLQNIGKVVSYRLTEINGAEKAAIIINQLANRIILN